MALPIPPLSLAFGSTKGPQDKRNYGWAGGQFVFGNSGGSGNVARGGIDAPKSVSGGGLSSMDTGTWLLVGGGLVMALIAIMLVKKL